MIQKSQTGTKWRKWSSIPCKGKFETDIFGGVRYWRPIESDDAADLSEERNFETLEVGRTYLSREGKVVTIMACNEKERYWPFSGSDGRMYCTNGDWSSWPHDRDLIRLLPDCKSTDSQPDSEQTVKLEHGKTYRSRSGELVTVDNAQPIDDFYRFRGKAGDRFYYSSSGRVYATECSEYDLVAEASPLDKKANCADGRPDDKQSATDRQEGGNHYASMAIQPIQFITQNDLNWFQGNLVKYACRYPNKNGAEDLRKVIHYAQLALQIQYGEKA